MNRFLVQFSSQSVEFLIETFMEEIMLAVTENFEFEYRKVVILPDFLSFFWDNEESEARSKIQFLVE